ncbi:hypothetical protein V8B97DRAFT_2023825 [Scleroderma yunnanense]
MNLNTTSSFWPLQTHHQISLITYLLWHKSTIAVKVLHLQPTVSPEQGARILTLCQGLQELTLQIATNLLDEENPLHGLLCDLQLTTSCMNIASVFYSPNIYLPNLLTHLSFHIHPPRQWTTHPEVLFEIFKHFLRLQVVIIWWMEYHASKEIYSNLVQKNIMNYCIVVFNSALFAECTESISSFWEIAEWVVQWWEDNQECCNVPSHILSFNLLA